MTNLIISLFLLSHQFLSSRIILIRKETCKTITFFYILAKNKQKLILKYWFSSVQLSHSVVSDSLRPHELQHTWPPCPSPTPGVHQVSDAIEPSHPLSFPSPPAPNPSFISLRQMLRLSFLLDKCPRTELLSCMVGVCFTFKTVKTVFQIDCTTLYSSMIPV